ncbi:hypothetical protein AK88_01945 [Plasmodium fragile]|uniref:Schizont-infected cell agglutination extracellular alpha domain-containing protein n=1 Tax=Plasmodium fragile TaxID=5857 RepID=A0A0D9QMR3_PLAFR|nr:uncharacterized protein AK88_01945 [Plasmodium fragile]KJP88329.1 hypothetical protein AK88_01945 [Plasmodium fragile]
MNIRRSIIQRTGDNVSGMKDISVYTWVHICEFLLLQDKIWADIRVLFGALKNNYHTRDQSTKAMCRMAYPSTVPHAHVHRLLCQRVMHIFLFMDGIDYISQGKWEKTHIFKNEERLEEYLRCMLGNVALLQLYGENCEHMAVVEKVSNSMDTLRRAFSHVDISKKCAGLNYDSMKIGTKFVGLTMGGWMEQLKGTGNVGSIKSDKRVQICKKKERTERIDANEEGVRKRDNIPIVTMSKDKSVDEVKQLIMKGKDMTDEVKKKIIETVRDSTNPEKMMEEILERVQNCSAQGDECVQSALEHVKTSVKPARDTPVAPGAAATPPAAPTGKDR